MSRIKDKLDDAFDIEYTEEITSIEKANTEVQVSSDNSVLRDSHVDDDYQFARDNIKELITNQKAAIEKMLDLSDESEHPRMFEVMSQMMKNLADTNKDLLEIHKKTKELKGEKLGSNKDSGPKSVNQTIFVGSTKELQDFFKKQKELPQNTEE